MDADTGFVTWAGMAKGEALQDPSQETISARLDYAVTQLLKRVPE